MIKEKFHFTHLSLFFAEIVSWVQKITTKSYILFQKLYNSPFWSILLIGIVKLVVSLIQLNFWRYSTDLIYVWHVLYVCAVRFWEDCSLSIVPNRLKLIFILQNIFYIFSKESSIFLKLTLFILFIKPITALSTEMKHIPRNLSLICEKCECQIWVVLLMIYLSR